MSTRSSIFFHYDEKRRIQIHIYEEAIGETPQEIHLEVLTEHAKINVPWPVGLAEEEVKKLAIVPDNRTWEEFDNELGN